VRSLVCAGLACAALVATLAPACSLGEGAGKVTGTLNVPQCWSGAFDLTPDFFAGIPYRQSLELRIQNGGDYETFSDGVVIMIEDINQVRPADDGSTPGLYGVPLTVSLPPAVQPPGVPIPYDPTPARVHLTLYLQRSCRTQNVALYAMEQVQTNPDGSCDAIDGSGAPLACDTLAPAPTADAGLVDATIPDAGAAPAPVGGATGRSTITFTSLFDGKPDETVAAKRLSTGTFDVYLADPRDVCPGGSGPPPRCRGHLTGNFNFYFQRGRPGQPFP
jgi:hypothetical protein